jgi:solute carrier family 7 (L-type amino acid transporter), member 5
LVVGDVYVLIDYLTFVESLFITMSISGLLWLRIKRPDALRPIKVHYFLIYQRRSTIILNYFQVPIIFPILFFIVCLFLVTLPVKNKPWEVGFGLLIIATGIPVYLICIHWRNKPKWMITASGTLALFQ